MIDWGIIASVGGMVVTMIINVTSLAYIQGRSLTRLEVVEKSLDKLEQELSEVRSLKEEIAVVKSQINTISVTLSKLENLLSSFISKEHKS